LFGTTNTFLDSFGLQNLDDLPTLAEIRDMETLVPELQFEYPQGAVLPDGVDEGEDAVAGKDTVDNTDIQDDEDLDSVPAKVHP
jgi:segregation and condensation protein B